MAGQHSCLVFVYVSINSKFLLQLQLSVCLEVPLSNDTAVAVISGLLQLQLKFCL